MDVTQPTFNMQIHVSLKSPNGLPTTYISFVFDANALARAFRSGDFAALFQGQELQVQSEPIVGLAE